MIHPGQRVEFNSQGNNISRVFVGTVLSISRSSGSRDVAFVQYDIGGRPAPVQLSRLRHTYRSPPLAVSA